MQRQLPVTFYLFAHDVGDDFLVRRADDEIALVAVLEAEQFGALFFPAARFLPQFGGLDRWH